MEPPPRQNRGYKNANESWEIIKNLALYDNESWNDSRDFAKPVKAISLPQDILSTSDRRLIELKNQVQRLMEAHLAPKQSVQLNEITSSCEICSGPYDTQYCMENPKQDFVDYASSRTDEAGGKWFEGDFKQQQGEITNKIDTVLKANTDRIMRALPNPQCSARIHSSINAITIYPKQPSKPHDDEPGENEISKTEATDKEHHTMVRVESERKKSKGEKREEEGNIENINIDSPSQPDPSISFITEKVRKLNSFLETSGLVPQSSDTEFVCIKGDDGDILFIEIIKKYDDSCKEELREDENAATGGLEVEYFDTFPIRSELACHKKLDPKEDTNRRVSNFTGRIKGMHTFIGNFTYVVDFMIVEDISSIIDPRLSQVVLGKPFVEISNMTHDLSLGVVKFTDGINKIAYKMPHKLEQYNLLSDLEKKHTKSVYLRNEEDKRRGVEYVMCKILGFYKECLELGPEFLTGVVDEG
ncbi:hypothetical protein Tco_0895751 [Tanacetum coccineum]|uniref:MAK10-like protein n=1 Tax=Tanacetum coccineum TaxID=301880 RepID=A0ABQ5CLP4_9ASTR